MVVKAREKDFPESDKKYKEYEKSLQPTKLNNDDEIAPLTKRQGVKPPKAIPDHKKKKVKSIFWRICILVDL